MDADETQISKDQPLIFDAFPTKVDQIPNMDARASQFIQELGFVCRLIGCVRLEFHNDFISHQQVSRVIPDHDTFELHVNLRFQLNLYAARLKLNLHGTLIHFFEKPEAENIVNLKRRTDKLLCYRLK